MNGSSSQYGLARLASCANLFFTALVFLALGHPAKAQKTTPNPERLAILRWYQANQSGLQFATGSSPSGVAFDGANLWVANHSRGTVTELRATDGFTIGSFPLTARAPWGVAFDGANIWLTTQGNNTVTKL